MIDRSIGRLGFGLFSLAIVAAPAPAMAFTSSNLMIPDKIVVLHCAPLRYEIHCTISRMANPEYSSFCFYVGPGGQSYPMKRDYRFGFFNEIVSIKVDNGMRTTGQLTEARTGRRARCSE